MGNLIGKQAQLEAKDEEDQPGKAKAEMTLKLAAQKIMDFLGSPKDWQKWKCQTTCALSGNGYDQVLDNEEYLEDNPRYNKVVFCQLVAAMVDGMAYHLIQEIQGHEG